MSPNRLAVGNSQSPYSRQQNPRTHAYSLSVGSSVNPTSRISRRKSSSSHVSSAAVAAINVAAGSLIEGTHSSKRVGRVPSKSSFPSSLPAASGFGPAALESRVSSAVVDGPPLSAFAETNRGSTKSRARRASEGSRLTKGGEGKRQPSGELKCDKCGKGYKHSSCLQKHLLVSLHPIPDSCTVS
jgi:hypothetical protein